MLLPRSARPQCTACMLRALHTLLPLWSPINFRNLWVQQVHTA
jgi:hypothetical protein